MRLVSRWATIIALVVATAVVSAHLSGHHDNGSFGEQEDVSECILLFGAYCNGNLGDVIQASTLSRLIANAVSDAVCVWHAHPSKEKIANGFHEGEQATKTDTRCSQSRESLSRALRVARVRFICCVLIVFERRASSPLLLAVEDRCPAVPKREENDKRVHASTWTATTKWYLNSLAVLNKAQGYSSLLACRVPSVLYSILGCVFFLLLVSFSDTGEFFANNSAGVISLGCDRESGEQVIQVIYRRPHSSISRYSAPAMRWCLVGMSYRAADRRRVLPSRVQTF